MSVIKEATVSRQPDWPELLHEVLADFYEANLHQLTGHDRSLVRWTADTVIREIEVRAWPEPKPPAEDPEWIAELERIDVQPSEEAEDLGG